MARSSREVGGLERSGDDNDTEEGAWLGSVAFRAEKSLCLGLEGVEGEFDGGELSSARATVAGVPRALARILKTLQVSRGLQSYSFGSGFDDSIMERRFRSVIAAGYSRLRSSSITALTSSMQVGPQEAAMVPYSGYDDQWARMASECFLG